MYLDYLQIMTEVIKWIFCVKKTLPVKKINKKQQIKLLNYTAYALTLDLYVSLETCQRCGWCSTV